MFSTKLTRAAPRATAAALSSPSTSTAQQATRCLATRPGHQRRQSSSKANTPPDSTASRKEGGPVPAEKEKERKRGSYGKIGKKTAALAVGKRKEEVDQFAGLPSVPSLVDSPELKKDLRMSSFFSLHRPISLTTPIPPPTTDAAFSAIFSAQGQLDPWQNGNSAERRPEDIIITLNNTIEMLEGNQSQAENEGVRWEIINESQSNFEGGVKHLDGASPRMKSLDELVANFRPFHAPPAPEPFDEKYASVTQQKKVKARKPKQKVYVTEIRVTESTHSDGRKTYAASSSPIRRLLDSNNAATKQQHDLTLPSATRQAFLDRMRQRQQKGIEAELDRVQKPIRLRQVLGMGRQRTERWVLISVKRQRKLKMKKHKHKKLMKRTRNLRRRQGRT